MAEIIETRRLNKYVKTYLLSTIKRQDVIVEKIGNKDMYCLAVKHNKNNIFEYKHSKDTDTVYVGQDIIARDSSNNLSSDMQDLLSTLENTIAEQQELKQIAFDRQNMMPYDIRAMETLLQLQR